MGVATIILGMSRLLLKLNRGLTFEKDILV